MTTLTSILYSSLFYFVVIYSESFVNLSLPNQLKFRYLKSSKLLEMLVHWKLLCLNMALNLNFANAELLASVFVIS